MCEFHGQDIDERREKTLTDAQKRSVSVCKREWENKLFASDLSLATKAFAMVVGRFAYGAKTVCWPSGDNIIANSDWNNQTRFGDYRSPLVEAGAMRAQKAHHTGKTNRYPNYKYYINLDWDGSTPTKSASEIVVMADSEPEVEEQTEDTSTEPIRAPVANAESEPVPESPKQIATPQVPVKGTPRDTSGLSGWGTEPVEPKPKFDLNAQLDEIEREQRENSKRDELETVPPSAEPDQRLAGW